MDTNGLGSHAHVGNITQVGLARIESFAQTFYITDRLGNMFVHKWKSF